MGKGKKRAVGQTSAHLLAACCPILSPLGYAGDGCGRRRQKKEAWTKGRSTLTGAGMSRECAARMTRRVGTDTPQEWRQVRAAVGVCKLQVSWGRREWVTVAQG